MAMLGADTQRAVAQRCVEATRATRWRLSELARLLDNDQLAGTAPLPDDLPVGNQLIRSFVQRINGLDEGAQRAMAIVAAAFDPTASDIHSRSIVLRAAEPTSQRAKLQASSRLRRDDRADPSADADSYPRRAGAGGDARGACSTCHGRRGCGQAGVASCLGDRRSRRGDGRRARSRWRLSLIAVARGQRRRSTWKRAAACRPSAAGRHRRLLAAGTSRWNAADPYAAIAGARGSRSTVRRPTGTK